MLQVDQRRVCGGRYQWDVQATVLRVAKSMRERGFRVWMDTEMMSGSTLDAMAAAVEMGILENWRRLRSPATDRDGAASHGEARG